MCHRDNMLIKLMTVRHANTLYGKVTYTTGSLWMYFSGVIGGNRLILVGHPYVLINNL